MKPADLDKGKKEQLENFKKFLTNAKTKGGYAIDAKDAEYTINISGQILCKAKVLGVKVETTKADGSGKETTTQDVSCFWNMNGQAIGNDLLSLVQVIE